MLELDRDYLRRFPKRTWQGSGGATRTREAGLDRIATADLYEARPPMLITEGHARVLTAAGRARLGEDDG